MSRHETPRRLNPGDPEPWYVQRNEEAPTWVLWFYIVLLAVGFTLLAGMPSLIVAWMAWR